MAGWETRYKSTTGDLNRKSSKKMNKSLYHIHVITMSPVPGQENDAATHLVNNNVVMPTRPTLLCDTSDL
jgi:hypothetical protein